MKDDANGKGQASERVERGASPSLAIDGARIRSVREAKKLTQLYVASVVGVTTDTISRWENNRYPSIKRDNAEKLAAALEVDLSEILRQEEEKEAPQVAAPAAPQDSNRSRLLILVSLLILLFFAIYFFSRPASPPTAVRWTPNFAAPGEVIPVQIKVTRPPSQNSGFILKEKLPDGLRLVGSLPPGSATEAAGSVVKWLVPDGSASITISYTVKIPESTTLRKEVNLEGEIVLRSGERNRTENIAGSNRIRIAPFHWGDPNGDARIDDDEIMPAYYICEEMKGLGLDWKMIEDIWSGKRYEWEPKAGFRVVK